MTRFDRHWPAFAFLASALALAIAHAFETFGHLAPCMLCLKAREIYWAALAIAAVGIGVQAIAPTLRRLVCALLALVFLGGVALAVYHAGAEWKFWPGPASCSGGATSVSAADLGRLMGGGGHVPSCEQAAWVFLGLSMAGWNAIASLILAGLSARAALEPAR